VALMPLLFLFMVLFYFQVNSPVLKRLSVGAQCHVLHSCTVYFLFSPIRTEHPLNTAPLLATATGSDRVSDVETVRLWR
jgi:hypothetical protein